MARRRAQSNDDDFVEMRRPLLQLAVAMRKRAGLEAGYTVLMMAVDEMDCLRAENAMLRTKVELGVGPMVNVLLKIDGVP